MTLSCHPSTLRELDIRPSTTGHRVLIASDVRVMRGFDYLGGHKGLCLVVDKGFSCQREADQALARVGRGGEICERFITAGTELIDEKLNLAVTKRLIFFQKKFAGASEADRVIKGK